MLILVVFLCANASFGQGINIQQPGVRFRQLDSAIGTYVSNDTGEGGAEDVYKFYQTFWRSRVTANDSDSTGHNMFQKYYKTLSDAIANRSDVSCSSVGFTGSWAAFGPDTLSGQAMGKLESIYVDAGDPSHIADTNVIYAGGSGGLFKTRDGGKHWRCMTDKTRFPCGAMGISHIAANPRNTNTIFLGTGMKDERLLVDLPIGDIWKGFGAGILESFDSGATWQQEFIPIEGNYNDTVEEVQGIYFTPDSTRLYALSGFRIFTRSNAPIGPWVDITPSDMIADDYNLLWDLQFVPGKQDTFFISNNRGNTTGPRAGIWEATTAVPDPATGWTKVTAGFVDASLAGHYIHDTAWLVMDMSVPDSDTLFFAAMSNAYNYTGVYKYNLSGSTHSITKVHDKMPSWANPSQSKLRLVVSPAATSNNGGLRNMYFCTDIPCQSHDGGLSFDTIGYYWGDITHGDIRDICLQQATNTFHGIGDRVYFATDGGVSVKYAGTSDASGPTATIDISGRGLDCGEYWSVDMNWDGSRMVAGAQHEGVQGCETDKTPMWATALRRDASDAGYDRVNRIGICMQGAGYPVKVVAAGGRELGTYSDDGIIYDSQSGFTSPLYVDPSGNRYVGQYNLWEQLATDPTMSWTNESAVVGLPISDSNYIRQLSVSPYFSSFTGYVLYEHLEVSPCLYYVNPTVAPTAEAKTGMYSSPITCVAMDSKHPYKVWIGFGGTDWASNDNRVNYSPDAGTHWYDVSSGLPLHLPVTKLIYEEGSSDVVFAATDAGIYRCDFSTFNPANSPGYNVSWTCFNSTPVDGQEFPNVFVTDLKINYCQGKLYAATYGRSIWRSDIQNPWDIIQGGDTITGPAPVTWYGPNTYITGAVVVQTGASLTISGDTVHMPRNGTIIVKPGGTLYVANSVITNDCDQCMWYGIEALGNSSLPQTPANQAWVVLKNSTLQHARYAVSNLDLWNDPAGVYATTGGVIQATNTQFLNNHVSASFYPYRQTNDYGLPVNDLSYFTNCTFRIDATGYKGDILGYPFLRHCYLNSVNGIHFRGCKFLNSDTAAASHLKGDGITAVDANFYVQPYCSVSTYFCPSPVRSRFCGLLNGVTLTHDGTSPFFSTIIDEADFDTVSVGIFNTGVSNVSTTACNFNVGNGSPVLALQSGSLTTCYQNIGVFTQNMASFRVENNDFEGFSQTAYAGGWRNIGVAACNTQQTNPISGNIFNGLDEGVYAVGKNKGATGTGLTGLNILCNTFEVNVNDIAVSGDGSSSTFQGIASSQGGPGVPTGNTFSSSTTNIINNADNFTYYYKTGSTPAHPSTISGPVYLAGAAGLPTCGTYNNSGGPVVITGIGPAEIGLHKSAWRGYRDALADSIALYDSLMDYGNTDSLVSVVTSSRDTTALYNTLHARVPFISSGVLVAVATHGTLPTDKMYSLAVACPDDLRDGGTLATIEGHTQFSSANKSALGHAQTDTFGSRSSLEGNISVLDQQQNMAYSDVYMALGTPLDTLVSVGDTTGSGICLDTTSIWYGQDSNSCYIWYDSVDAWLQQAEGLWGYYARAGWYFANGSLQSSDDVFTTLSAMTLSDDDAAVLSDYSTIWTTLEGAYYDGRNTLSLDSVELAPYESDTAPIVTYNAARQVIHIVVVTGNPGPLGGGPGPFGPPCLGDNADLERTTNHNSGGGNTGGYANDNGSLTNPANWVTAYPNPSNGLVTFRYAMPTAYGDLQLVITNIVGEEVWKQTLGSHYGAIDWDGNNTPAGIYIYRLSDNEGNKNIGRLVIVR